MKAFLVSRRKPEPVGGKRRALSRALAGLALSLSLSWTLFSCAAPWGKSDKKSVYRKGPSARGALGGEGSRAQGEHFKRYALAQLKFNRFYTNKLLAGIERMDNPNRVLSWRPGPNRAHIGWQLTHVAFVEDRMVRERFLKKKELVAPEEVVRFIKPKKVGDKPPDIAVIKWYLEESRAGLEKFLREFDARRLDEKVSPGRKMTFRKAILGLVRHEPHHHGQAHITLNLYLAATGKKQSY